VRAHRQSAELRVRIRLSGPSAGEKNDTRNRETQ
jgi:hypothetical protein